MPEVKFIAAIDEAYGLVKNSKLPWDLPSDRKFFYDSIANEPLLIGWKTFADNKRKPFRGTLRTIVLTHRTVAYEGVDIIHDLDQYVEGLQQSIWVSGSTLYEQLLDKATHLYLTRVKGDYNCDAFFPEFENLFVLQEQSEAKKENGIEFRYQLWTKPGLA